jgi:hypothetical protein
MICKKRLLTLKEFIVRTGIEEIIKVVIFLDFKTEGYYESMVEEKDDL